MQSENLYADWAPLFGPEFDLDAVTGGLLELPQPATARAVIAAAGAMMEKRELSMGTLYETAGAKSVTRPVTRL
jgi:hypothetical protein